VRAPLTGAPLALTPIFSLFASKRVSPVVYDRVYALDELTLGLQDLEARKTWGKVVVRVQGPESKL
jgi:NADPH:quinone reductase